MLCERIPMSETNPKVWMDTYILEDSEQYNTGLARPAVLVMPGGAYAYTSDREAEFVALEFNTMGYHAFVLRYSVGVDAMVPAPMLDGFRAIACIRDNAEKWHVAPDKLVVCGFSAGGNLAACLLTMWKSDVILRELGIKPELLRPDVGILCYSPLLVPHEMPPADTGFPPSERETLLELIKGEFKAPPHPDWEQSVFEKDGTLWFDSGAIVYLNCFGSISPPEELLRTYSIIDKVDGETPPIFLWATAEDERVPAVDSAIFAQAMLSKGRPVELHIFGSGEHGLSLARVTTGNVSDNNHPARRWVKLAATWLEGVL